MVEEIKELVFLIDKFDGDNLREFYQFSLNEGKKVLFLASSGGAYSACIGILDIINRNPKEYTIRVSEYAMSAALQLIRFAQCSIEDVSTQFNLDVYYLWHSTQDVWEFSKEEVRQTILTDERDFEMIKDVLTKKQIKKRNLYYFWVKKWKHFARVLNDNVYLSQDQIKLLLGDRFSIVGEEDV